MRPVVDQGCGLTLFSFGCCSLVCDIYIYIYICDSWRSPEAAGPDPGSALAAG